jgi:hypothetical protein
MPIRILMTYIAEQLRPGVPGAGGSRCHHRECSSGGEVAQRSLRGAAAVASLLTAVLAEIYLCNVCSC